MSQKALRGYLASEEEWANWDSTKLVATYNGPELEILIDQVSTALSGEFYCPWRR